MATKKKRARKLPPPGAPWSTTPGLVAKEMHDPDIFDDEEDRDSYEEFKREAEREWTARCYLCDTSPAVYYGAREEHWRNKGIVQVCVDFCEVHAQAYADLHGIPLPPPTMRVVQ
jgi:hypothetical protein